MAVVIRRGERYGDVDCAIECDRRGCYAFVTLRDPANPGPTAALRLARATLELAADEGWRLSGATYCPKHAEDRPERAKTVGDGYVWARIAVEGVKGSQRLS